MRGPDGRHDTGASLQFQDNKSKISLNAEYPWFGWNALVKAVIVYREKKTNLIEHTGLFQLQLTH